ncbi:phosphoribosylamine--glycine ligase [Candidatus Peribacteria bacterium]|nr:phosphoribosylamine--glycine ligase [Candidatus Peribacteria bacterium]
MRILLISNSARGHAIAEAFSRSPQKPEIIAACTGRDPGMMKLAKELHVVDINGLSKIVELAKATKPDFAFIAPDDPIGAGLADRLESIGVPCVAPKKNLAKIESSKSFARNLMNKYGIDGSPAYRVFSFSSMEAKRQLDLDIRHYIEYDLKGQYVIKYDALKGGKGVKLSGEHLSTIHMGAKYAMECIDQCGKVVIEEKLTGVEFSVLSFVSGLTTVDMPAVQDYKRAYIDDKGPNTGGMGTYSDANHFLPFLSTDDMKAASNFNAKIAEALMKECGEPYKGILYGGFIATKEGVKIIEYNARFGDPEALNILPILETDFVAICQSIIAGTLSQDLVKFAPKATVCKYITPKSYPEDKKEKGQRVLVPERIPDDARLYYGDVTMNDTGCMILGTSRSIGVVGIGDTIGDAEKLAQEVCERFSGPVRFRQDIATIESIQKRVDLMQRLRGR